ncbi:MAG: hypothetical protein LBE91_14350 [Tannerella sp.]|nr:hypothetical protein [Tannerella sp.]
MGTTTFFVIILVIAFFVTGRFFEGLEDSGFKRLGNQSVKIVSGKFKLEKEESRHLQEYNFEYRQGSFCYNKTIFGETVRLYLEMRRELQREDKYLKIKDFDRYFKACEWFVLNRMGIYNENIPKSDENDDIVQLIKYKSDSYLEFPEHEKLLVYCMSPVFRRARYNWLTMNYDYSKPEAFYQNICMLRDSFQKNRIYFGTIEKVEAECRRIFFSAHQFLADRDRTYSLLSYLQYLNVETSKSENYHHKTVPKEIRPVLFGNKRMEERFGLICNNLKRNKDWNKAEADTLLLLGVAKRKIELNRESIEEEKAELSETAQMLEKYLQDEETAPEEKTVFLQPVTSSDPENELIILFQNNDFALNKKEIDKFALEKGLFSGSMIQKINEKYFEKLDDVLIEESENSFVLNREYLEKL